MATAKKVRPGDVGGFLRSLGDTPQKVANSLKVLGIKGKRSSMTNCPITNAICKYCPDVSDVIICDGRLFGDHYHYSLEGSQGGQPFGRIVPTAVLDFVGKFDDGAYNNLVQY